MGRIERAESTNLIEHEPITVPTVAIGTGGMVGSRFAELSSSPALTTVLGREELDITKSGEVEAFLETIKPQVLINFAAYTNVDKAEEQRGNTKGPAWRINVEGTRILAQECKRRNIKIVYFSTDYIFPGTEDYPGPYTEEAKPVESSDKITWYGWTKRMGEGVLIESEAKHAIVRISYPYRAHYSPKGDYARNILDRYQKKNLFPMFGDQFITPTFIDEAAQAVRIIVNEQRQGIFHVAPCTKTTPFLFASRLIKLTYGVDNVVELGSFEKFARQNPQKAKKWPKNGGLDVTRTQGDLGIQFMTWDEALEEFARQFTAQEAIASRGGH